MKDGPVFSQPGQPQKEPIEQPTKTSGDSNAVLDESTPKDGDQATGAGKPPTGASNKTGSGGSGSPTFNQPPLTGRLLFVTQALNQGLVASPRVAAARAQLDIAKALYVEATELPNPVFLNSSSPISEQTFSTGVQSTITPPWKIAFRLLAAKRQVKETKLEILNSLWQFRADVRRAYTELVVAVETAEALQDLADLSKKLWDVAEKRFKAGDVPELDVLKARLAYSQAEIDLAQGERRVIRARQQLNIIMGSPMEQPINMPRLPRFNLRAAKSDLLPDFSHNVPPQVDMIALSMANRLELKIVQQQIALNQAKLYQAIGNVIPDPVIQSGGVNTGNPPTGPKLYGFFIGVNLELPVFSFSQGDIARQKATIRQLFRQFHAQENVVTAEVSSAYNSLLAARQRILTYQDHVLADSLEVARLARLSYEVGQSDITSTLAAQQANIQIRSQYLDAVNAYQEAFTDLERSVGEPLQ